MRIAETPRRILRYSVPIGRRSVPGAFRAAHAPARAAARARARRRTRPAPRDRVPAPVHQRARCGRSAGQARVDNTVDGEAGDDAAARAAGADGDGASASG